MLQELTEEREERVESKKSFSFLDCGAGELPNPTYFPPWLGGRLLKSKQVNCLP